MSDEIDYFTEGQNSRKREKKLYTRCNKCSQFYQVDAGTPCPNRKCGGDDGMSDEKPIEERIKEIRPYNHCRSCGHFIRVNFEGPRNVMHRQGFCMVGRLCGDFSLYYSASETECMAYYLLKEHAEIEVAETSLSESEKEFVRSTEDKRSKNYKTIEPFLNETREFIQKTQKEHAGLAMMMALREVETTAHKWYQENHSDDYMRVYKMVSLRKNDHSKYLAKITMLLHDEYCKCDKIEYTGDKVKE